MQIFILLRDSIGIILIFILVLSFLCLVLFKDREEHMPNPLPFSMIGLMIIIIFSILEESIAKNYSDTLIISIFTYEMFSIILLSIYYWFAVKKNYMNIGILPPVIVIIFAHVVISGAIGEFIAGLIIVISMLTTFGIIFYPSIETYLKGLLSFLCISVSLYMAHENDCMELAINSIITISAINFLLYEPVYRLLFSYYHSIRLILIGDEPKKVGKIAFYRTKITITQIALDHDRDIQKITYDYYDSFIKDYFGSNEVYGIEIECKNKFSFSFILNSLSKAMAIKKGETVKAQLQTQYRGLDAEIEIIPMTRKELYTVNHTNFYEVKLPRPPFMDKFTVIQSFINAFKSSKYDINLYVMWKSSHQRNLVKARERADVLDYRDEEERGYYSQLYQGDCFKVKIFVSYKISKKNLAYKNKIDGLIDNIAISGRSDKKTSKIVKARKGVFTDILKLNFFLGRYITSYLLDLDFAKELPVKRKLLYELESFDLKQVSNEDPSKIIIGNHIIDGRKTEKKAIISIKSLRSSVLFIGRPHKGKTYLIATLLKHIKENKLDIGGLIINLAKGDQDKLYPHDYVIKWENPELRIPYAIFNENFNKCLMECSEGLAYSLGLNNVFVSIIHNTLLTYYIECLQVPRYVNHLFSEVLRYMKANPYDHQLQMRFMEALKKRCTQLFSNPFIINGTQVDNTIPKWVKDVLNGKIVMLDLSGAKEQLFLSTLILQMFRTLIPDKEQDSLKYIIVLDEAHRLTEEPDNVNPEDDVFIAKDSFRIIFNLFIREFRSKGTSLIIADQNAVGLYESVVNVPCLFFLFNQSIANAQIFTTDIKEQELISRLEPRECMLKDGSSSYLFYTEDFATDPSEEKKLGFIDFFKNNNKR